MLNIAICDDDISTTGKMDMLFQKIAKKNFVAIETAVFWDGKSLVKSIAQESRYDVIFLDIQMNEEDGISVAKKIREKDRNVLIIYVTSYEKYMLESFLVRPFRFLIKPVDDKQFELCFKEIQEEIGKKDFYFRYSYRKVDYKIPVREILYFESDKRKILIITEKNVHILYKKLNEIEKVMKNSPISFLRIHQSFLVNYHHISKLAYDFVEIDNGKKISISEDRRKKIREQYCLMEDNIACQQLV